jgi:putative transposase
MIDREHDLPITKQAAALNISRGSVYYLPRPVSAADLTLIRGLTSSIWSSPSPEVGCCAIFWLPHKLPSFLLFPI